MLESHYGIEVVGMVSETSEALRSLNAVRPELVLLDTAMRNREGLTTLRDIKLNAPGTRVLVMTEGRSDNHIRAALRTGADGYVLMDTLPAELGTAISAVLDGKRFISPRLSSLIAAWCLEAPERSTRLGTLTHREKQVLKLIAEGKRNREIAACLFISIKTVEKHRSNLMHKLELHNTAALTTLAIEEGLVSHPSL
jgi:DNA-binding NarL/FixJ family response regulator